MKNCKLLYLFLLAMVSFSCSKEEALLPNGENYFPEFELTPIGVEANTMFEPYNTFIEYRYNRNLLPTSWFNITPMNEKKVIPATQVLLDFWVKPLEDGSSHEFVCKYFPSMIVMVGSPAYQFDGSEVLGQAEGGSLIRFTRMNEVNPSDTVWLHKQMTTAFHEYAHILHQTFIMPNEFMVITPNAYTKNGWMSLDGIDALKRGMVSAYGTMSVQEDFAELFATYILTYDALWDWIYYEQPLPEKVPGATEAEYLAKLQETIELNQGRVHVRKKFNVLVNFLKSNGLDIHKVRESFQEKYNAIKSK